MLSQLLVWRRVEDMQILFFATVTLRSSAKAHMHYLRKHSSHRRSASNSFRAHPRLMTASYALMAFLQR